MTAIAVAPRRKKSRRRTGGWWGDGLPPWERWPGVTVRIDAEWNAKLNRWESHEGRYFFDAESAKNAVDFFPVFLSHHIGAFAGKPFELMDYQRLLLTMPLFGWVSSDTGLRRFRKVFAFLPKGAGKSPWGAGTGLYLTLCDNEPAAEVYAVAADTKQARVVHDNARIMVEESPDLLEMCEVLRDSVYVASSRSTLQVLSSDAATKHGFRPHGIVFDEIHAQKDRKLYEALTKSMKKRRQPVLIMITHAGDDDEGICYEEYEYAKRVLSGTVPDETCLPVIFEASSDDDWTDERIWKKVNPGHGITVSHAAIAAECEEAKVEPRKLNDFLRFTLNRWVNQATAWIPIDWWDACQAPLDDNHLRSLPVFGGLDMSQKLDLTALVLTFKEPIEGAAKDIKVVGSTDDTTAIEKTVSLNFRVSFVPFFWLPADTLRERVKQDRVPYDIWRDQGLLRVTEGYGIDYTQVIKDITGEITERFPKLKGATIGYDPAFASDIAGKLRDAGYTMVEILQNYRHFSEPCHIMEAMIKGKQVRHDGHRVLRWNFENVAIRADDSGRIRPVKTRSPSKRIDGVVASAMGVSMAALEPTPAAPSIHFLNFGNRA